MTDSPELIEEDNLSKDHLRTSNRLRGEGDRSAGFEDYFKRIGVSSDVLFKIRNIFGENGLTTEQKEQVLCAMCRIVPTMQSEGESYELDSGMRNYFKKIGLNAEQIKLVLGTSRRIVSGLKASGRQRGDGERDQGIEDQFSKIGINTRALDRIRIGINRIGLTDKQTKKTLGGLLRIIFAIRSEGESFELDPKLNKYFGEIGLTRDQIEWLQGLAHRLVQRQKTSDRQLNKVKS